MSKTHYQLLAIAADADLAAIKAATRRTIADIKQAHYILSNPDLRVACKVAERQRYCELLEVDADADCATVKLAAKHTADALRQAFQVLNNPDQRQHYDAGLAPALSDGPDAPVATKHGFGLSLFAFALTLMAVLVGPQLFGHQQALLVFFFVLIEGGMLAVVLRLPQTLYRQRKSRFFNSGSALCWSAALLPPLLLIYQAETPFTPDKVQALRFAASLIGAALAFTAGLLGAPLQAALHGWLWTLRYVIGGSLALLLLALLAADIWLVLRWHQGAELPF